ncbi:hypothetical protein PV10_02504 [Exophiala mesophila]|uniref:SMP-30/Gluconolactonase/LRE-like region domain-containing protein n=1 Tax=Exophiala mesophila TaxID=212818 RepID=A0A0D1ZJG5_EXOME|nr:uncharacterized protein PV10_02504 [Exophiala mesophila]KIV94772.1 hypothetical protein PV10_02504 [Exophiala mesophila]
MARPKLTTISLFVALGTLLYQSFLRETLFVGIGLGRTIQPISDFPFKCYRITGDPNIQACEDMWLDHESRTLYLACSDSEARKHWMPNIHRLNATGRATDDRIVAMDIDNPTSTQSFTYRVLKPRGYSGVAGDGRIHVVGMTGTRSEDDPEQVNLWLINARPSVDSATGEVLDNTVVGGNHTIDVFSTKPGAVEMDHVQTYADVQIATPNNLAVTKSGGFFYTNDHGPHKVGWKHHLSLILGTGDVSYCSKEGVCKLVSYGHKFPNGLHLGTDGLLYVPSAAVGGVKVYRPASDGSLTQVHHIRLDYPIDNISEDANGDLYLATMPKGLEALRPFDDPLNAATPPATVWRVRRLHRESQDEYEYELEKIIEDRDGEMLPGMTTVIHDAVSGRLFMSGVISRFVTVCEPK